MAILGGNGDDDDYFSVDGLTLSLDKAKIDFEAATGFRNKFTLTIKVTDTGSPTQSVTKSVVINVVDRNERPTI